MELMSIASGSSGNCIYVGNENTSILVDTGISMKRIEQGLNQIDKTIRDLDGIFITHEHVDHIKGLGTVSRKYGIPIYATAGTIDGIKSTSSVGKIDDSLFNEIIPDNNERVKGISVCAHSTWHDANDPVCYSFYGNDKKISVATDMGDFNDYIIDGIKDSDAMLIESNHDVHMLEVGPYPYMLKKRILGKNGHMSNETCGKLLSKVLNNHIKAILLGHLSKENNFEELAYETVKCEIADNPFTNDVRDFNLKVASKTEIGELIQV